MGTVNMREGFLERRNGPRVGVGSGGPSVALPAGASVQILDISQTGVLLASPHRLDVGQRAQLRTRLGAEPLTLQVEICRVMNGSGPGSCRLGARFVHLDEESRKKIERLLRTED